MVHLDGFDLDVLMGIFGKMPIKASDFTILGVLFIIFLCDTSVLHNL